MKEIDNKFLLENNTWYYKTYIKLIKSRLFRGLNKTNLDYYTEVHHILPRSLGGTDDKNNLVLLTAREHLLVHILICKAFPDNYKLRYSIVAMTMNNKNDKKLLDSKYKININTKLVAKMRENALKSPKSEEHRRKIGLSQLGERNHQYGKVYTEEERDRISKRVSGKGNPMYNRHHTEKTKELISKANSGKAYSEERKNRMSIVMKNKYSLMSDEERKKKYGHSRFGKDNPMYDKKLSSEHIKLLSNLSTERSKEIIDCNTGIVYRSAIDYLNKNPNIKVHEQTVRKWARKNKKGLMYNK